MFNLELINQAGEKAMQSAKSLVEVDFITSKDLEIASKGEDEATLARCMKLQHSVQGKGKAPLWMPTAKTKVVHFKVTGLVEERDDEDLPFHGKEGEGKTSGNNTLQVFARLEGPKGVRSSLLATLPENHVLNDIEVGSTIAVGAVLLKEGQQFFRMALDEGENAYKLMEAQSAFYFIPNGIEGSIVEATTEVKETVKETVGRD